MAEEPKPEVAVEQEAAAADGEATAKAGKSFEERLAELKKPEAVPQPKEEEVNSQLSQLNSQITTWDKRLTEIKAAIEKANSLRDGGRSESKDIVEKLKAVRARIKAASSEREDVFQQLRELTQARQAQQKNLQDLRRSLKFDDVEKVSFALSNALCARSHAHAHAHTHIRARAHTHTQHTHTHTQCRWSRGCVSSRT
jgi:chromosome segregation ATPase